MGYPSLKNKNFGTFLGEIHRINPEILGYPRIPGYPLTTSLHIQTISTRQKNVNGISTYTNSNLVQLVIIM